MKTKLFFLISILSFGSLADAQNFAWAYKTGGTGSDFGNCVTTDAAGNVYAAGYFQNTVDFDPGVAIYNLTAGFNDAYVTKFTRSGNFVWARKIGGTLSDVAKAVVVDTAGGVYITGAFQGTADFDPGVGTYTLTSSGNYDAYICKLDAVGNFAWAKQFAGSTLLDQGSSIALDGSNNVITTGIFQGTTDFDPGAGTYTLTPSGGTDIFVSKLTSAGNFVWAKKMGGTSPDEGNAITTDASGNIYVAGAFQATADFDPGAATYTLTAFFNEDVFVEKLDAAGNFVWAGRMGGVNAEQANGISLDGLGNIYTTGIFGSTADFDPDPSATYTMTSAGNGESFISKLNSSGNFVWARQLGGIGFETGYSIDNDAAGNVYSTGHFQNTADFDPGVGTFTLTASFGNLDAYVSKLDPSGNFVWAFQIGDANTDAGKYIHVDALGSVYTVGDFTTTPDFDPGPGVYGLTSAGAEDVFVQKLCLPNTSVQNITACDSYIWNANTYTISGTYLDTIPNVSGCDSIMTLNLTIKQKTFSVKTVTACDKYIWQAQTYTVSGTYMDTIPNSVSCDSVMTLNLTIKNSTTFIQSATTCDKYMWQANTYTLSGTYSDTLTNAVGCDSILILNLTIKYSTSSSQTVTACSSYFWHSNTYTSSGTYVDTLSNAVGCDSITTLLLNINNTFSSQTVTSCDNYTWNASTYSVSGTYIDTVSNSKGCDSIMTLNLTIKYNTSSTQTVMACNNYSWNSNTYTVTGTYHDTIPNAAGCDSVMMLNLIVKYGSSWTFSDTACNKYMWNAATYTVSGIYTDTVPNSVGCDSIITLNLVIKATSSTQTITACGSYLWNANTYTISGTYLDTILNSAGCDSIMILNLTINTVNTTVTQTWQGLTSNATGATYQWINCNGNIPISGAINATFTPTMNGSYAVVVTKNGCTDTSLCYAVNDVGINEADLSENTLVYPNPSIGIITIEVPISGTIEIYNSLGKKIIEDNNPNKKLIVNMSSYPVGIYFMKLKTNKGIVVKKIIIG